MNKYIVVLSVFSIIYAKSFARPNYQNGENYRIASTRCMNMWDDGCVNGQLNGAGGDDGYLNGNGFNPGKRCVNMWDDGCVNGQLNGAGGDDSYLNGNGFNPGKRCINMWDDGCVNGQLNGAGGDDGYLNGNGFNPGKRSFNLFAKLQKSKGHN